MNVGRAALDAFFLTRPVLWIPVWGFCAFGFFRARSIDDGFSVSLLWNAAQVPAVAGMVVFSLSVGIVYILNQIADIEVDRQNAGFALMAHGGLSRTFAWSSAAGLGCIGIAAAILLDPGLVPFMAGAAALGYVYSFKPAFFSGRPVLDFISNALGYGIIAFGAGWHLAGKTVCTPAFLAASAPYFLLMCAGSISSTLPDYDADHRHSKKTTAVVFGKKKAHAIASLLVIAALMAAVGSRDIVAGICAGAVIPLYALFFARATDTAMEAVYKIGGAACVLCAAILLPAIVPPALIMLLGTLAYFRVCHNISYPSLVPVKHVE